MGRFLVVAAALAVAACHPETPLERGTRLFGDVGFARAPSNVFSCATCHSTLPGGDPDRILPGYVLRDVVGRPAWWGGAYHQLLDAVNECYVAFMRGTALAPDDPDGLALLVYLESVSPSATSPALPFTLVLDIVDVPNGDAARGADLYRRACAYCHGDIHTGAGRSGPKITIIPDGSLKEHGTDPKTGARPITIEKVRHGNYFGVGGNMALYTREALADAQLGDILAYLGL